MARRLPIEIIADSEHDDIRTLRMMEGKARSLRMSEDTKVATTAAKWERAIHQALQNSLAERNGK